jgi:hypothetical protein
MSRVEETIPPEFAAEAEAARQWFAHQQSSDFKLTGIVDPDDVLAPDSQSGARELQLILCGNRDGQDVCLRERFAVTAKNGGFDVTHLDDADALGDDARFKVGSPAPLLDPPKGVRSSWLDDALKQHAFVVLVFYRGFW